MNRVLPALVMILIVGVVVAINTITNVPLLAVLILIVALLCIEELGSIVKQLGSLGTMAFQRVLTQGAIVVFGAVAAVMAIVVLDGSTSLFGQLVIPNGLMAVVFVMVSSIVFENTIAWAAGRAWSGLKRHFGLKSPRPAFPRYSPNKTVVGSVAGALGGIALGVLFVWSTSEYMDQDIQVLMTVLAIMTPPLSEWGDWLESRMKRNCDVKDSNSVIIQRGTGLLYRVELLMGGHGGFVDRTDSMFFCLAWSFLPLFVYMLL
jgi:CDP-diglyceride synthetase